MPLQVAISFIGNLLMNTNNQRRMQMNSTSRPCSTRHEIIKTIPTLRLQLQTNFILRATLSGVPRGRPSVRVVVTTTAAPIYCVHSLSLCNAQTGGEFSSTENLVLPKKKVQKNRDNNTTTNATEGSGGDGSRLSGNGFFCAHRPDRKEPARCYPPPPPPPLQRGGWGNQTKKITSTIFPSRGRAPSEM